MRWTLVGGVGCVLCGLLAASAAPGYQDVLIEGVPHVQQRPDFCGEACVEMAIRKLGYDMSQDDVFDRSGLDPSKGRGCYTRELKTALENIGFMTGQVGFQVPAADAGKQLERQFALLHADLVRGVPSIVCTHFDESPNTTEHFRLVLGYDGKNDQVIYHEPAEANGAYRRMGRERFLSLWPLKYHKDSWTVIRIRLQPDRIVQTKAAPGLTPADYAQHVMELKNKVSLQGFHIVVEPPFVIVGDEPRETVERRAEHTVKWAVDMLKKAYFEKDPEEIIDVFLFRDDESYQSHAKSFFGDEPHTPFGYYSDTNHALVMNIATGGGTLVHEIVHPFVRANFPRCPAWFNEGLGSLYEQSSEANGSIRGLTNWRLAGLQQAIRRGELLSFETLTGTSDDEFYRLDPGSNYAQARYLCYYLQEQGLLLRFYQEFVKNQSTDPSGFETLKAVLGEKDIDAFQKKWEAYVLKLTFPG